MSSRRLRWDVGYTGALLLCGAVWLAQQSGFATSTSEFDGERLDEQMLAQITEGENSGAYAENGAPTVILLVAEWCGYCRAQEKALKQNSIPFKKLDIEKSEAGQDIYRRIGRGGIPITIVGGSIIRGYDPRAVIGAFNRQSSPAAMDEGHSNPDNDGPDSDQDSSPGFSV